MKLRGVEYGPISCGSGAMGFFGDAKKPEYWFSHWLRLIGLIWTGCGFVAKTMTRSFHKGNLAMKPDGITPRSLKPDCLWINFFKGVALSAGGCSNPGVAALLADGRWQTRTEPFMLSFTPVSGDSAARFKETQEFVDLLASELPKFEAPVALQVNISFPNTGHSLSSLEEHLCLLDVLEKLDIPLVPKIAIDYPPEHAAKLAAHRACDALCVTNLVKFGTQNIGIRWSKYFASAGGSDSPLAKYGGGGLSGKPLLTLAISYVRKLRWVGVTKPIQAGGGILQPDDVQLFANAGANSVFIASVAFLRPWRVRAISRRAHEVFMSVEKTTTRANGTSPDRRES